MVQRESRNGGIGGFVGFLVGVGVGLLFANKPGRETRKQLVDLLNRGKERGNTLISQGREQIEGAKEKMTSEGGKEPFYESGKYT